MMTYLPGRVALLRFTPSRTTGDPIASCTIGVTRNAQKTDWFRLVVFQPKLVELLRRHVTNGRFLGVEARPTTRHWTDRYDQRRISVEFVVSRIDLFPATTLPRSEQSSSSEAPPAEGSGVASEDADTSEQAEDSEFLLGDQRLVDHDD